MTVPGSANPLLTYKAAAGGISRSLRFNSSDSAYLSRTPASAGNRKTWTWAGWVKRSRFGQNMPIFGTDYNGASYFTLYFVNANNFAVENYNASYQLRVQTTQLFRDPSAWFHLVVALDTTQGTASDRCKIYVNGSQVTALDFNTYPSQNTDLLINNNQYHEISTTNSTYTFGGYLADIYFIDGQALTPSSFTETDATTGQLIPKAFSGSYGSQGWHLEFADNSSNTATTLGKDTSGNGNNWTPNNLSVTAGASNDSLVDVPTNGAQTDTGVGGEVRGNYAVLNPLDNTTTLTDGNLNTNNSASNDKGCRGTIAITSGKWYWEVTNVTAGAVGANASQLGISTSSGSLNSYVGSHAGGYAIDTQNGNKFNNAASSSYLSGASAANSVHGVAFDADNGTITFYRNGSTPGTAYSSIPAGTYFPAISNYASNCIANFGQRPFAYTAPSGFKALCTANLPAPVVTKPNTVFDVKLYTGNGSTQTISGLGFSPDLVWYKHRSAASSHGIFDIVRGTGNYLTSNGTGAEIPVSGVTAFNSDGFTLGSNTGGNGSGTWAAWCWDAGSTTVTNTQGSITSSVRANATAGFSVVTYTGTGANATVGHGLGVAPSFVIVKSRSNVTDWQGYHVALGQNYTIQLQSTSAAINVSNYWNGGVSSTTFGINGSYDGINFSGYTYVAYCFAPVVGYSSFGSYSANGLSDGPMIFTNFRPRFVMVKQTNVGGQGWFMLDSSRSTYNVATTYLLAQSSNAEASGYVDMDFLSNGFKIRSADGAVNASGGTYIYAAFAESPFNYARAR